jgi:pimeloyl-ACP methyl ester carboxylesterase
VRSGASRIRDLFVRRSLQEADRRGWDRFFVVADGWSSATAARVALERRDAVLGIALGHASLSFDAEHDRAPVNREVWAAMGQLLRQDHREFIRHGMVQVTRGSLTDDLARQMMERLPDRRLLELVWDELGTAHEPVGEMLREIDAPLLFAQHQGCLTFTDEGFEDAVNAFPNARVLRVPQAPATSPEFAQILREFCEEVGEASRLVSAP